LFSNVHAARQIGTVRRMENVRAAGHLGRDIGFIDKDEL